MSDVLPAWAAITNRLAAHAPTSHATLRPGATAADVQSVEDGLGASLPADLVTLLLTCNGTVDASDVERDLDEYDPGLFLAQHHLLPLEAIVTVLGSGESAVSARSLRVPKFSPDRRPASSCFSVPHALPVTPPPAAIHIWLSIQVLTQMFAHQGSIRDGLEELVRGARTAPGPVCARFVTTP
ncbi:hypothetical protein [Streptomyces sp. NBC_00154]|uniref:hypothetical protein n=1 Tax=Streptomyces sp. NBC_00154 TaxID=2975670 RepID=UPI002259846B|nr:hypothetical protein [Streptomyces sp. NBC_00154]MCX5315112.1 hypothetical protein [Streptomyces sp. NBC_00154]